MLSGTGVSDGVDDSGCSLQGFGIA